MIILHSEFAKASREFVEQYGDGNTVLAYPECVELYPGTPAFPALVVEVPEKVIEAYTVPEQTNEETGETIPESTVEREVIPGFTYILPEPESLASAQEYIDEYMLDDPGAPYR